VNERTNDRINDVINHLDKQIKITVAQSDTRCSHSTLLPHFISTILI